MPAVVLPLRVGRHRAPGTDCVCGIIKRALLVHSVTSSDTHTLFKYTPLSFFCLSSCYLHFTLTTYVARLAQFLVLLVHVTQSDTHFSTPLSFLDVITFHTLMTWRRDSFPRDITDTL